MKKAYIETYGCQMNVNDTEVIFSILAGEGYERTESMEEADLIMANTCSVHTESYRQILAGNGFRIGEARPCIEIVSQIRNATPVGLVGDYHPLAKLPLSHHPFGWDDRR